MMTDNQVFDRSYRIARERIAKCPKCFKVVTLTKPTTDGPLPGCANLHPPTLLVVNSDEYDMMIYRYMHGAGLKVIVHPRNAADFPTERPGDKLSDLIIGTN